MMTGKAKSEWVQKICTLNKYLYHSAPRICMKNSLPVLTAMARMYSEGEEMTGTAGQGWVLSPLASFPAGDLSLAQSGPALQISGTIINRLRLQWNSSGSVQWNWKSNQTWYLCKMCIYNKNKNPNKSPRGSQSAILELKCRAKVRISNTNVRTCLTFWLLSEREVARTRKLQNGGHWQPLIRLSQAGKPSHRLHHARLQNPFKQDLRHFFIRIKSCTWNQEAPRQFYQFSSGCLWLPVLTIRLLLTCFSKQPTANMLNITINSLLQNILR